MSMSPPPGWYPDPSAPHLQRWWDGTAWTEHRSAPTVPLQPASGDGGAGGSGGGSGGSGRGKVVALVAAGAVLVAAIVAGAVYLRGDDGDGADVQTAPNPVTSSAAPTTGDPSPSASPSSSEPSADDPSVVVDQLNGITLPLLDGWVRPQNVAEDDVVMTTDGTYDCPGDSGVCRHGLVISRTATDT